MSYGATRCEVLSCRTMLHIMRSGVSVWCYAMCAAKRVQQLQEKVPFPPMCDTEPLYGVMRCAELRYCMILYDVRVWCYKVDVMRVEQTDRTELRYCYTISGTEQAYSATAATRYPVDAMRVEKRELSAKVKELEKGGGGEEAGGGGGGGKREEYDKKCVDIFGVRSYTILLRACYAKPGTEIGWHTLLRACYAESGTAISHASLSCYALCAYAATTQRSTEIAHAATTLCSTEIAYAATALCSTEIGYAATRLTRFSTAKRAASARQVHAVRYYDSVWWYAMYGTTIAYVGMRYPALPQCTVLRGTALACGAMRCAATRKRASYVYQSARLRYRLPSAYALATRCPVLPYLITAPSLRGVRYRHTHRADINLHCGA
eukprot:66197-Rhodomonas_salina.1